VNCEEYFYELDVHINSVLTQLITFCKSPICLMYKGKNIEMGAGMDLA